MALTGNLNGVDYVMGATEEAQRLTDVAAALADKSKVLIRNQIIALEMTVTQRRLREALRGQGAAWLANVDDQIAALRAQLS